VPWERTGSWCVRGEVWTNCLSRGAGIAVTTSSSDSGTHRNRAGLDVLTTPVFRVLPSSPTEICTSHGCWCPLIPLPPPPPQPQVDLSACHASKSLLRYISGRFTEH
jgi:hypothetical protein